MRGVARTGLWFALFVGMLASDAAWASELGRLRETLRSRFQPSMIEVQNAALGGDVIRRGVVLSLEADGVPAKRLRIIRANTKSPRFHVSDYARVIVVDDRLEGAPSDMVLGRGTRLVVLGLSIDQRELRLFTHTLEPVRVSDQRAVYGCTEFVFPLDPSVVARQDIAAIEHRVGRWLRRLSSGEAGA